MSILKVDSIFDSTGLLPPTFPAGSAQLNPMAGREDKIINGDMGIWQRSLSSTALGYVAADRWQNGFTGGTVTQSQQSVPLGFVDLPSDAVFYLRQTVSGQSLSTHYAATNQNIEDVRSYSGKTITVLGWARRASGAGNMCVEGIQRFGSGGSPSADVTAISPTTIPLTTSFAPFAVVLTVPSISGKTLGTVGDHKLVVSFWTSGGSNYNARNNSLGLQTIGVDLWGIHIRQGTWTAAATADYRPRDPGTEMALCQRYYQTTLLGGTNGAITAVGQVFSASSYFPVTMRATPSPTQSSEAFLAFPSGVPAFIDNGAQGVSQISGYKISTGANTNARWTSVLGLDAEL